MSNIASPSPKHPWANGQVERMNRTINDAAVKRFHCEIHADLRSHVWPGQKSQNDSLSIHPRKMPGLNI
ncbi:hypothetical protein ABIF86_000223 [Bradyrhizobium japonicum]